MTRITTYAKTLNAFTIFTALVMMGLIAYFAAIAAEARGRAEAAQVEAETALQMLRSVQEQVDLLNNEVQALDQQCQAQYEEGWIDAEMEATILGDPPYDDYGC